MKSAFYSLALPLLTAPIVMAQSYTITSGNVSYNNSLPATLASTANFRGSPCSAATDNLFAHAWAYKIVGTAPSGRPFDDIGHGSYAQAASPGSMLQTIGNVGGLGFIDATITDIVTSTGTGSGSLISTLTVTNTSANPVDIKLWNYADVDFNATCCGTTGDYTLPGSGPNLFVISDNNTTCRGCLQVVALTPSDFFQVNPFAATGGAAANIVAGTDLPNTGLPFASEATPADFVGAFQWNRTIAPSATVTISVAIELATTGVAGTNTNAGTALGGAGGAPTLTSATLPRLGRSWTLDIGNGGAAASATILFGIDPAPVQLPILGLQLMTPASGIIASVPVALSAGSGSFTVPIGCSIGNAGVPLCTQAFVLDPTSPASLPLSHSDMLLSVVGD